MLSELDMNPQKFSMDMITISNRDGINIIDTITYFCEKHDMDIDSVLPLLDKNIIERIKTCGIEERYVTGIRKSNTLF